MAHDATGALGEHQLLGVQPFQRVPAGDGLLRHHRCAVGYAQHGEADALAGEAQQRGGRRGGTRVAPHTALPVRLCFFCFYVWPYLLPEVVTS